MGRVVNNPAPETAYTGETQFPRVWFRQFPWLTREDIEVLATLPIAQARSYERFLRRQAAEEQRYRDLVTTEADLTIPLEQVHGARAARWSSGAGGGRRKPTHPTDDQNTRRAA